MYLDSKAGLAQSLRRTLLLSLLLTVVGVLGVPHASAQTLYPINTPDIQNVFRGATAWGDYDNDGDLDLLVSGCTDSKCSDSVTILYDNDGGTFTVGHTFSLGFYDGSVAWGDYDNDGDLDLALTGRSNYGQLNTWIINNDEGSLKIYSLTNLILTGVYNSSVEWGDYDNDGDLDLVVTGCTGGSGTEYDPCSGNRITRIYVNDEGILSDANPDNVDLTGVENGSSSWGDYDGDGDLDLLITGQQGTFFDTLARIYHNSNGNLSESNPDNIDIELMSFSGDIGIVMSDADWGDYDNDGDLDLAIMGCINYCFQTIAVLNGIGGNI